MEVDQGIEEQQYRGQPPGEEFDYQKEKLVLRALHEAWRADEDLCQRSIALLNRFKAETGQAASSLCEQLRIVLEPQLSQQLQGDYRTGKRLNMKKVISFIASHYRNDKIWLRRTLPSKRDYKILVAIDDTASMKEQNLGFFSLEAMVTLVEALNRLEAGKVAVARIRDRMELLQSFEDSYSNERTAFITSQYSFEHSGRLTQSSAMANFVRDANKLLDFQNTDSQVRGGTSCPIVIVLSDGRMSKNPVRRYMREAMEKKYLYVFVILDAVKPSQQPASQKPGQRAPKTGKHQGILSLREQARGEGGKGVKLVPYLRDFPFSYYCIVKDLQ